jgi:hypothetical protein
MPNDSMITENAKLRKINTKASMSTDPTSTPIIIN